MPLPTKAVSLIKGYLPVRIRLPDGDETTFIYVKEHRHSATPPQQQQLEEEDVGGQPLRLRHASNDSSTLFVANCPTVPGCRTKLLLQSIFGRYGEVSRVTVIPNPRQQLQPQQPAEYHKLQDWTPNFSAPTYHYPSIAAVAEGKFAHVVFTSTKEMKRTFKAMQEAMSSNSSSSSNNTESETPLLLPPALTLDKIELQTLSDETERQLRQELGFDDDDDNDMPKPTITASGGILAVAARYRASCQRLSDRNELLNECNAVVQAFEDVEARERRERDEAVPDDDGFVTVSYSATADSKRALEVKDRRGRAAAVAGTKRPRQKKKNKGVGGAEPLPDFYRFQAREHRKKSLHELRQQFQEDLVKVKQMKEERQYRPF
jgi:ribosomal RNA-processing protein 7